jgi:CorA-like Mg2+ transporter protein
MVGAEDLGDGLASYYRRVEDDRVEDAAPPYELPDVLIHRTGRVTFGPPEHAQPIHGAPCTELLIFALPFPADQVVATLIFDFTSPDVNEDPTLIQRVLDALLDAKVCIDGVDLATHVERLGGLPDIVPVIVPGSRKRVGLPRERHQLVLIRDLGSAARPSDEVTRKLLYCSRLRFTNLLKPRGLNHDSGYGAVSSDASLLCGHSEEVEYNVFLTTVQAVGTASRFQQIWQDAYHQVQDFQEHKQKKEAGLQKRKDLETLADHLGNLELDLAFSVQTAADLGLNPSTRIDSFHNNLYRVMQIRERASTVGRMFDRLGGSIRSELTAIESRERQEEEERRRHGNFALSVLTCIIAPITFLVGFFGMNVLEVPPEQHMWNWRLYRWAYAVALFLFIAPLATFGALQWLAERRRRACRPAGVIDSAGPPDGAVVTGTVAQHATGPGH